MEQRSLLSGLICIAGLFVTTQSVTAQCNPPAQLPTQLCQDAPLVCLLNACYSTQPWDPNGEPDDWCGGNYTIENPQYFLFQAIDTLVVIIIEVTDCLYGSGALQSAIIDTCGIPMPWTPDNILACDGEAQIGELMILASFDMIPGQYYWLMIDGFDGQICEYRITDVQGIYSFGIPNELESAGTDDPVVCPGQDIWTAYVQPFIPEAHGYLWTGFPWPPGYHTTTYPDMSGPDDTLTIPEDAPPGIYEICVVAFSGCDTTDNPVCFDLEIAEIDGYSEPVTVCSEEYDSGIQWHAMTITEPGIYVQTFNSVEGCPHDSTKEYFAFPEGEGVIDTIVCAESFSYEGEDYFNPGFYSLFYGDSSMHGCDSVATLNLDLSYIEAVTNFTCIDDSFQLSSEVLFAIPGTSGLNYEWYHDGILVSMDPTFETSDPGTYELFVSTANCVYPALTNPLVINLDELVSDVPELAPYSNTACADASVEYFVNADISGEIQYYEWSVDPPEIPYSLLDTLDSGIAVSWQGFIGGTVCVHAVNHCAPGQDTCFNVTIIPAPYAAFVIPGQACVDSTVMIQFTGEATMDAAYIWNFGGGIVQNGGAGSGPHEVYWTSPGIHTVTLQIGEIGCDSNSISHDIFIEVLGQPQVFCTSTLNSITFEWLPVSGATGYEVNAVQGPAGVLMDDTSYVVTNLTPGTVVEIEVTALGTGACPSTIATAECIAQSCPPKMIQIEIAADSFCLGEPSGAVILSALVDGIPASGIWSGQGVDSSGNFDPNIAGAGTHMIAFLYTQNTCTYSKSIVLHVFESPTALISNTTFTLTCENHSELILDGTNSIGSGTLSFLWTTPDGLFIGPANESTATAGAEGEYTLTVIDEISMCEDDMSVTLIADGGIPDADAGPDGLINCNITFAELGGSSSAGPSIAYAWSTNDGTIDSDPTAATITVTAGGTYILTVTDNDNGCSAVDQALVVTDLLQPSGSLAVSGILDCSTEFVTISADVSPSGVHCTYTWETSDGSIVSGNTTPEIVVDHIGIYILYVTNNDNGCMDTVSIGVMADPESISGINAIVDNPGCVGDQDGIIEIINLIGGTPPFTYAWSNQTSGSGLLFLSPGTYTTTVTDANGCSFVQSYTLPAPIPVDAEIGADIIAGYGDSVNIVLSVTDPGTIAEIIWDGVAPPCPGCFENSFEAERPGTVTVTVIDTNGCEATDMLTLSVEIFRNIFIPNVFSPNGDNINDIFTIRGKILDRIEYMRIFDRWGALVYEQPPVLANGQHGWDGTRNGEELNPGVFVYTALLVYADGKEETVSGDVTLLR